MFLDTDMLMFTAREGDQELGNEADRDKDTALEEFSCEDFLGDLLLKPISKRSPTHHREFFFGQ